MKATPIVGVAISLIAALALAGCGPESEPETAAKQDYDPAFLEGLEISPPNARESDYIKGLSYHGGGWGFTYKFGETEDWFWIRYWSFIRKPQAVPENFSSEDAGFEIPAVAVLDLADVNRDSVEFDPETSAVAASGGDASLAYTVQFIKTGSGLQRTVSYKTGHVQYVTFDDSILDAPVSRDVRTAFTGSRQKSDEFYFEMDPPEDESDRVGVMILWEPRAWVPLPAIAFLPFDEIENFQINLTSIRHTMMIRGTGFGKRLHCSLTVNADGHSFAIVDLDTREVLISAQEVYEADRDETRED